MRQPVNPRGRCALRLERLESRTAPAALTGATTLHYQDRDGDNVAVTFSKPILTAANANTVFAFDTGSVDGHTVLNQQLRIIDVTSLGPAASGVGMSVIATRSPTTGGDGFAAVGQIIAFGIDLGAVTVDGDLGGLTAGDGTTTPGLKSLTVQSLGRYGTATGAGGLQVNVTGALGSLHVKGDVQNASVFSKRPNARIGSVVIGGSLIGNGPNEGEIISDRTMGFVTIGGDVAHMSGQGPAGAIESGNLAGITIGGSIRGAPGVNGDGGFVRVGGNIGSVTIHGSLIGGGPTSGFVAVEGAIASVSIGGSVIGGGGNSSGVIFAAGSIGTMTIGGDLVGGNSTNDLTYSGTLSVRRIGRLMIGGSLIAGTNLGTGNTFQFNGAVAVIEDLGSVWIGGSIVGNPTNRAVISARGQANPSATTDVAIGSIRVLGRVELARILAGYDDFGKPVNADAQIGSVSVGGDWVASDLVAGAVAGSDGQFGTADDAKISGSAVKDDPAIFSAIKSVTIGGQVVGVGAGGSHFGFVAEAIGALRVGGTTIPTKPGKSNDDFSLGITNDVSVLEIT